MPSSYFVVAEMVKQTKKGPVKHQVVFGGRPHPILTYSQAERFAENLSGPTSIHHLETTQSSRATQLLRGKGVLKARKEGKDWSSGMVRFNHGKVD